jgi:hypothetical protein
MMFAITAPKAGQIIFKMISLADRMVVIVELLCSVRVVISRRFGMSYILSRKSTSSSSSEFSVPL